MSDEQTESPEIVNFANFASLAAGAIRVFVLDNSKSDVDSAQPWVRMRCKEAAQILDFCSSRINALEEFVTKLTEVKAITDTEEFGVLLDELMTHMEEESEKFRNMDSGNDN